MFLETLAAEKKYGKRAHRFIPMSTLKSLKVWAKKGSHYTNVFFPYRRSVTVENKKFDSSAPVSKKNPKTKTIEVPTGKFGTGKVINVLETWAIERGVVPPLENEKEQENPPIDVLEVIINAFPHEREEKIGIPCYSPVTKKISTPPMNKARSPLAHYGTVLHELGHQVGDMFGELKERFFAKKQEISQEELTAEFTSLYVLGQLGFNKETEESEEEFKNSEIYIGNWCKFLKENPKCLLEAATDASKRGKCILEGKVPDNKIKNREDFPYLRNEDAKVANVA